MSRRILLRAIAAAGALPGLARPEGGFPQRPLRLVVPVAAGGSQDNVARLLARHMGPILGQPIIVDNRPGAAGNIGYESVARARPDGLTLAAGSDNLSINRVLFPLLGFDPVADFAPIAEATTVPQILVVRAESAFRNLADFLDGAARRPLAVGTGGNGSLAHLLQQLLQDIAGRHWTHAPYRGGALAVNDLLAGTLDAMMGNIGAVAEQLRAGALRGLAVSSPRRLRGLPMVPSFAEAGLPAASIEGWHGLVAPRGTPDGIIALLHRAVMQVIAMPDMLRGLDGMGITPKAGTPAALGARMEADARRWQEVVRRGGLRAD